MNELKCLICRMSSTMAFSWLFAIYLIFSFGLHLPGVFAKSETEDIQSNLYKQHRRSFPITTLINAKWKQTPLHLEIVEYLADENVNLFWDFLNELTNLETHLSDYDTESQRYNVAMAILRDHLSEMQMSILKLIVSMHSLTVRIQSQLQISRQTMQHHLNWIDNGVDDGEDIFKCTSAITFAIINSQIICDFEYLEEFLLLNDDQHNETYDDNAIPSYLTDVYNFDHIYPGTENYTRTLIVYTDIGSKSFAQYHNYMKEIIRLKDIRYIVRHYIQQEDDTKLVRLSGYGVELHLKSTEYKSQDDAPKLMNETSHAKDDIKEDDGEEDEIELEGIRFSQLKRMHPELSHLLDKFRQSLLQTNEEIAQLKAWEFQDLGVQAAVAVTNVDGEESLKLLQFISHNFPLQAKSLLTQKASKAFRNEIEHNMEVFGRHLNILAPDGALFINGIFFDADTIDLNNIIEVLRLETRIMESLHQNNLTGPVASSILTMDFSGLHFSSGGSSVSNGPGSGKSNSIKEFAIDIRDRSIIWINDIETDEEYRQWPSSVMDLLRPTYPGMLRNIRKNIFNLVVVIDPLHTASHNILKMAESVIIHMAPLRIGLVFDLRQAETNPERSNDYHEFICAFNYVVRHKNGRKALGFLTDIFSKLNTNEWMNGRHIRTQFQKLFNKLSKEELNATFNQDSDYDYGKDAAAEFIERLGFDSSPQMLLNGVPMPQSVFQSESDFEDGIISEIIMHTNKFQKAVYKGHLTDNDDVLTYLMSQPHVMPRLNQRILDHVDRKFLDFSGKPHMDLSNVKSLLDLSHRDMTATLLKNLKYFETNKSTETIGRVRLHFLTIWIVTDLDTASGQQLLENALRYLKTVGHSVRITFIPNTEGIKIHKVNNLNRLVWSALQTLPSNEATELVLDWLKKTRSSKDKNDDIEYEMPVALHDILKSTELHVKMLRVYAQRVLGVVRSASLIISNGFIIGPLDSDEKFTVDDFTLLERFNAIQFGDRMRHQMHILKNEIDFEEVTSDTIFKIYGYLLMKKTKARFKLPEDVRDKYSVIELPVKHPMKPYFDLLAILDPASRGAQKVTPILNLLRTILNCRVRVFLTPLNQHSDMPVTNFYRYVIEPEVQFQSNGALNDNGPIAKFVGLPMNPLLTQNLQIPENWLVEVVRSVYDLDNIRLNEIGGPVHSEYELEYLLLEGHCFDSNSGSPPRGLQIILGTKDNPNMVDTIVMANLGYFQLKANPGVWWLRLREGKSMNIYDITYADGPNTIQQNDGHTQIVISSLRSHVIKLRVTKKSSMQDVDLLSDEDDETETLSSGIWNSITSSISGITEYVVSDDSKTSDKRKYKNNQKDKLSNTNSNTINNEIDPNTINIFSVASGHLYERLLRIMMLSLLKHTKSPVKFWFLKNYLSPQFTEFLPHMAREYNFQYELVQYKWPRWLHQQTEKQRTIWGYKILFLDVLFPLNIRKIIFVDADAIVRADLKELYTMNLNGAPYAYTPFCDSRKDMEGFRFWNQGYWRNHLMGRRYHISALYVVDLKRFRRVAAGDRLRGQYQALSQDPNSLANLDQDLPNNMIHQVAIKSLPIEWLWCQTWCSDASLKNAKVIDLCNNPLTKEAKLTAAQRIVPEWKSYDTEVKLLMSRIEDHENSERIDMKTVSTVKDANKSNTDYEQEEHKNQVHGEL